MKSIIVCFLSLLLCYHSSFAQTWQWVKHGGSSSLDYANSICTDPNGNVYVMGDFGYFFPSGGPISFDSQSAADNGVNQLFLVKYSSTGTVLWVKSIGGLNSNNGSCSNCEQTYGMCYDPITKSIYMTGQFFGSANFGTTNLFGYGNMFFTRIDQNGNVVWAKAYGNIGVNLYSKVSSDQQGFIYLSGLTNDTVYFDSVHVPQGSFWVKFDSTGLALNGKIISADAYTGRLKFNNHSIYSIFSSSNDTIVIDTVQIVSGTAHNIILAKFDSSLNVQWVTSISSNYTSILDGDFDIDDEGNSYITAGFNSDVEFGSVTMTSSSVSDFFVVKYDSLGNYVWSRQGNSSNIANTSPISTTSNGDTYVLGGFIGDLNFGTYSISSTVDPENFVVRYNSSGNCLGAVQLGQATRGKLATDQAGSLIVAGQFDYPTYQLGGFTLTNSGTSDIFIAKHDVIDGISELGRLGQAELLIYANPNAGKCTIEIPDDFNTDTKLDLKIFDNTGRLIQSKEIIISNNQIHLELEAEAKGIYNVKLSNRKKTYSGKIIFE